MDKMRRKPEKWRRYVEREGLVSVMNATKWRETTEAMMHMGGGPPGFRIKDILGADPDPKNWWDHEWYYHCRPWETIEWLEIQPDVRMDEIISILKETGVPMSMEGDRLRIWGWLRPGFSPNFA